MEYADQVAVKIVTLGTLAEPLFGESDMYVHTKPCTIFARWIERTGVLWIEHIIVDGIECNIKMLSEESFAGLQDACVLEICATHF